VRQSWLATLLLACLLSGGCGYSDEERDQAYRSGHRAGIIWCKRHGDVVVPDLDEELLAPWRRGWLESTSLQCEALARDIVF
jgi:hypothetical protein